MPLDVNTLGRRLVQSQVLLPDNASLDPTVALAARVKDPLWFLARQWQTGEFAAENGGRPVEMEVTWERYALDVLTRGEETATLELHAPLEPALEEESHDGGALAWQSASLDYEASLAGGGWELALRDYEGRDLDWYHCDVAARQPADATERGQTRVVPSMLYFEGMPHPRWWRFEEAGAATFDPSADVEPNVLSLLVSEYLCLDANNWFVVPLVQTLGLSAIAGVRAVDSFGVATDIPPSASAPGREPWGVFTLANTDGTEQSAALMLVPSAGTTVDGDVLEEIRFIRDEQSNFVWAVEDLYFDVGRGQRVRRGDEPRSALPSEDTAAPSLADAPAYRLTSALGPHWVPYVPVLLSAAHPEFGQIFFRRARSVPTATAEDPQYRGRIIRESWRLLEEEIPRLGLRVQRRWRYAQAPDGTDHFWIGRRKDSGQRESSAGLEFDYLE